ncbi:MAG TPA: HNH endonuclease [Candidatus Aminicenantes bacterium]|nr:HNH endonuclease [Candidatus Aminicenantes bacterium]HRY65917.1 HNH endonuclease [Candidatus Aminicenantes bacterium]HRZ72757.1 HNH endonuclease [Candidatus Aminicenantes bacterium]
MEETNGKCAYCESKVGHNCPGDIEHKIPVDDRPDLLFNWDNLIISCTECNRRKGTYYDESCMFLDPNKDDVESRLQHIGPLVFNKPGDVRAEVTVRLLEIDRPDGRPYLMGRKYEKLENTRGLVKSIVRENNVILKAFLIQELEVQCSTTEEYSAMVKAYVDGLPPGWANQTASPMGAT